ncbi:MAG: GDSL-type esterase/lipase family protein, partial [Clostridia bacterium]
MLGGEIGTSVINAGYSGDTTDLALKRIDDDVISKSPDVVIIMFGMNDQALKISTQKPLIDIETYEKNYRTIIKKCQAIKADIILMTGHVVCTDANYYVPGQYDLDYSTGIIDKYYDVIRKLANEFNLDLIDLNAKLKSEKTSEICALGDGIHLSPYGQKKYSEYIGKFMFEDYTEDKNVTSESSEEASSKEASSKETSESNSKTESSVGETSKITSESNGTNTENDKAMTYIVIGIVIAIAISAVVFFV